MDPISLFIILFFIFIAIGGLIYSQFVLSNNKKKWVPHVTAKLIDINHTLDKSNSDQKKYALIETDKLLDYVLKKTGAKGETMGERLKYAKRWFEKDLYNRIWESHKTRNMIVHEVNSTISDQRIIDHIKTLQKAIKSLTR